MTDTITREVAELEELFANELPCGGVGAAPYVVECPSGAAATWVCIHHHGEPGAYKCNSCHQKWLSKLRNLLIRCKICGWVTDSGDIYRKL